MQVNRNRVITQLVAVAVLATGAWSIGGLVKPDGGSAPSAPAGTTKQAQCAEPTSRNMTYWCRGGAG